MPRRHTLTAILPCNDLDASEAFYAQLGFAKHGDYGDYRILADGGGGELHLTQAVKG
jgi:catechol 2,3-dioxygenase-like lactoylglutathione lyase family enzyme